MQKPLFLLIAAALVFGMCVDSAVAAPNGPTSQTIWYGHFATSPCPSTSVFSGPGTKWLNIDQQTAMVTCQTDPLGSGIRVGRFDVPNPSHTYIGSAARADLEGPELMSPTANANVYASVSTYVPLSTLPAMTTTCCGEPYPGHQVMELYGPPYHGSPMVAVGIEKLASTSYRWWVARNLPCNCTHDDYWRGPTITTDSWHSLIVHINWSPDPTVGYVELWYDGQPQSLIPQTLTGATLATGSTGLPHSRLYYANWTSQNNGAPNFEDIDLYANGTVGTTATEYQGEAMIGKTLRSVEPTMGWHGP